MTVSSMKYENFKAFVIQKIKENLEKYSKEKTRIKSYSGVMSLFKKLETQSKKKLCYLPI